MKKQAPAPERTLSGFTPTPENNEIIAPPILTLMGVSVFDPVWTRHWHQDTQCELICVLHGKMTVLFPDQQIDLSAGDLTLIPAGVRHRDTFDPVEEPDLFFARFLWDAAPVFFQTVTQARIATLPRHDRDEAHQIILRLRDHSIADSPLDRSLAQGLLYVLLLQLWCAVRGPTEESSLPEDRSHDLMSRARRYIDAHFREPLSLDRMAEHLHVSPYYLSRIFSQESGFSITSYLTSIRMEHARKLLRDRVGNVSEVAFSVGYESSAYFSRVFKRHFGVSPRAVMPVRPKAR